jgi:small conductance mechanosensitive channel
MAFLEIITGYATQVLEFLKTGLGKPILIIIILISTLIIERIVRKLLHNAFEKSSKFMKVDHTQYAVLKHITSAVIYVVGIGVAIFMIPSLKALSISLFAGAGVLAIIIGFASQAAFANIVSGIFIAIFKPFRVGDTIQFGSNSDKRGVVEDITLRHTVIRNFENKRFVVPNSIISGEIVENYNLGDDKICRFVDFGISYDSDINKAMKIMREEAMKHPLHIDNRKKDEIDRGIPTVVIRTIGFSDSSVNLRAWVWAKDPPSAYEMGCDLNKSIKEKFDKEGIEIPFPYRTIVYKDQINKGRKFRR